MYEGHNGIIIVKVQMFKYFDNDVVVCLLSHNWNIMKDGIGYDDTRSNRKAFRGGVSYLEGWYLIVKYGNSVAG